MSLCQQAVRFLVECRKPEGFWQADCDAPTDALKLARHRIIYTTQIIRALGELGRANGVHSSSVAFLEAVSGGAPLFDYALKVCALWSIHGENRAVSLARSLASHVDHQTGFIELGRRRQSLIFDALFTAEALLTVLPVVQDPAVVLKLDLLFDWLSRMASGGYKFGTDLSLWAWYMTLCTRRGIPLPKSRLNQFADDLLSARNAQQFWSPPPITHKPELTSEIHGSVIHTAHVVMNLAETSALLPASRHDDLLLTPVEWLIGQFDEGSWRSEQSEHKDAYVTATCLRALARTAALSTAEHVRSVVLKFLGDEQLTQTTFEGIHHSFSRKGRTKMTKRVFIVHGHDDAAKYELAHHLEREFKLEPVILHEQPNYGSSTIIEKFEKHAGECAAAFILLTPDDKVVDPTAAADKAHLLRARQNVIFEMGFFVGRLGRQRVFLLHKGSVEIPSDVSGVIYIPFNTIEEAHLKISRELQELGLVP